MIVILKLSQSMLMSHVCELVLSCYSVPWACGWSSFYFYLWLVGDIWRLMIWSIGILLWRYLCAVFILVESNPIRIQMRSFIIYYYLVFHLLVCCFHVVHCSLFICSLLSDFVIIDDILFWKSTYLLLLGCVWVFSWSQKVCAMALDSSLQLEFMIVV